VVTSGGSEYTTVADAIGRAAVNLRAMANTQGVISMAVTALSEQAEEIADRIEQAQLRYAGVGKALTDYAGPLTTAQAWSLEALATATTAQAAAAESNEVIDRYRFELMNPLLDEESREKYQRLTDNAAEDAASSNSTIAGAVELLQRAIDLRDTAAATASEAISEVESTGGLNDGFWDNVDQFYEEHKDLIDGVLFVAGIAASILAAVALFVPGLNLIVLGVGIALAAATVLNSVAQAVTGNMSWTEAIINTALALVPFGVGKIASTGIAATRAATHTAAVTSLMSRASSAGVSGITRSVATSQIDDFLLRTSANAVGRVRISPDVVNLADIRALAGIRMANGGFSASINAASAPAVGYGLLWAGSGVLGPAVEPIAKLPFEWLYDKTTTVIDPLYNVTSSDPEYTKW
jgi:hypothetical protein